MPWREPKAGRDLKPHMPRAKAILLSLLAVFAVSAAASAAAAAAGTHIYKIEGSALTENTKVEGDSLYGLLEVRIAKLPLTLACQEDISSGEIKTLGEATGKIEFKNCYVYERSKAGTKVFLTSCSIKEPTIAEGTGVLIEHSVGQIKGKGEKETFATLTIEGEKCAVATTAEITGSQLCASPEAEFEKVIHTIVCTPTGSKLVFNKEPVQLFGEEQVKLASSKNFSAT